MDQITQELNVKSYQEVWKGDKELLASSYSGLNINWSRELPDGRDAGDILIKRQEGWQNPKNPFKLDKNSLDKVLNTVVGELEVVWGKTLENLPDIEILSSDSYVPSLAKLDEETNKKFGYGSVCRSPPTMFSAPDFMKLLIPQKFLARVPRGMYTTSIASTNFDVLEFDWERPYFEEVLFEELSHSLFRQLRGEWGEDYVAVMKKLGPDRETKISAFNEAIAQFGKEVVAKNKNYGWNLYVVADKIGAVWQNRRGMDYYRAVDALSKSKSLVSIAAADVFSISNDNSKLTIGFYSDHMYSKTKQKKFEEFKKR